MSFVLVNNTIQFQPQLSIVSTFLTCSVVYYFVIKYRCFNNIYMHKIIFGFRKHINIFSHLDLLDLRKHCYQISLKTVRHFAISMIVRVNT